MNADGEFWYVIKMMQVFRITLLLTAFLLARSAWAIPLTVNIVGLDQKLRDQVKAYLDIAQEQSNPALTLSRLQRLHDRAPQQIRTALQVYGYYHPQIRDELQQHGEAWTATYTIDAGTPVRIAAVDIQISGEGSDNASIRQAQADFPLAKGQVFEHPRYDQARDNLFRAAIEQGFLDCHFSRREVKVDVQTDAATVILTLETGTRYYFGPIRFIHSEMHEAFLRRYLSFKQGEPYNPAQLLQLQTALSDSGLFQTVDVKSLKAQARDNQVPIEITLGARKHHQWRFGLGYATDTGPRGSVDYSRIVGNNGDKFESKLLLSQNTKSLTAGYTIPLADPVREQLAYVVRYKDETTDGRESIISGLTVRHTDVLGNWQRVMSLNYDREVYTIEGLEEQTGRALYPVYSLTRVEADNRIYTRDGYRIYAEVRGANKNLLSDTNYAQIRLGLKWIRGLGDDGRLLLRGDFGSTNVAYLKDMPLSQRFFAGGDNSVRGYGYNELGPKDSFGYVVGGKHLIVGSVEYEHRIAGNWSGAVFYDVGNAVNSMSDPLMKGAGFGVRWNSPVGPVRFDFAWGLDKETDRFRLHVVIGPDL
ncbi:MAG: BamA/TamA family outer membrane protein [Gammaproteobacteria bacterium]|nr:BamA/TamA family outer membrane protein [Gammaproteobacteria bacterium]